MGYIYFYVVDLEEVKCFYVDGFGFEVMILVCNGVLFVLVGGYYYYIGLNMW